MSLTGSCFSSESAPGPLYGAFFVKEFARAAHLFPSCFEHDGTLNAVAMTIRGEPAFGARFNRATTLYPVGPRTRTMMQSCEPPGDALSPKHEAFVQAYVSRGMNGTKAYRAVYPS